jgi:hypothetical protein
VIGGRRLVLETTLDSGVVLVALSRWIEKRKAGGIYWWPGRFTGEEQERYQAALLDLLGARYESPKWMALRVALRRSVRENDRWFCSEIEARARKEARPTAFELLWPDPSRVWPCHVVDAYGGMGASVEVCA